MKGLSKKEMEVVSDLEFRKRYFFTREDIEKHFDNKKQMTNSIYNLKKKGRIVPLNKNKYYLVPIKARTGAWAEHPFIVANEMFDGEDYFIGGWAAAHYWNLTNQVPMQVDIYTTKRQGEKKILNTRYVFHRTTENRIGKAVAEKIGEHEIKVMNKEETEQWMKSKE